MFTETHLFTDLKKLKKLQDLILENLMMQSYLRLRLWLINTWNQAPLNIDFIGSAIIGSADFFALQNVNNLENPAFS